MIPRVCHSLVSNSTASTLQKIT